MNKIIAVIIIAIVALGAIGYVSYEAGAFSVEEKTAFGSWKSEIKVDYADGGTETLQITNPILSLLTLVSPSGREIESITYCLYIKVIGEGYTLCEFDFSSFSIKSLVEGNGISVSPAIYTGDAPLPGAYGTRFTLGDTFHKIATYRLTAEKLEKQLDTLGDYKIRFIPTGSVKFKGVPNGDWADADIPGEAYVNFKIIADTTDIPDPPDEPPSTDTHTLTVHTCPAYSVCEVTGDGYYNRVSRTGSYEVGTDFTGLETGTYTVKVLNSGWITKTRSVYVDSNKDVYIILVNGNTGVECSPSGAGGGDGGSTSPPVVPPTDDFHTLTAKFHPFLVTIGGTARCNDLIRIIPSNGRVTFELPDGTYTVECWTKSATAYGSATVTINGADKSVDVYILPILITVIPSLSFGMNTIPHTITPYYQDENHYLGEI